MADDVTLKMPCESTLAFRILKRSPIKTSQPRGPRLKTNHPHFDGRVVLEGVPEASVISFFKSKMVRELVLELMRIGFDELDVSGKQIKLIWRTETAEEPLTKEIVTNTQQLLERLANKLPAPTVTSASTRGLWQRAWMWIVLIATLTTLGWFVYSHKLFDLIRQQTSLWPH